VALIELSRISKTYRLGGADVNALCEIDLAVERGEFSALWGPSGSGKSTLLNLVGLIDQPTSGHIRFDGADTDVLSDSERAHLRNRSIGFVFQSFNLVPVLSALENVMLPLMIRGVHKRLAREAASKRLSEVGLDKCLAHRPDQLSGGQRQRVAIARALVTDPLLVIADEPTANLDAKTGLQVVELMSALRHQQGVSFLFSTHDPRLLDHIERVIPIEDGRLVAPAHERFRSGEMTA
jgi:putative ABC transport system ATP-binding protein